MKSVKKFKVGLKQLIVEMIVGFCTNLVLQGFVYFGLFPDSVKLFISIFIVVANILLIKSMLSWGVFYTIGWLIGSLIFLGIGLLQGLDIVLYVLLPAVVLTARVSMVTRKRFAL